VPPAIIVRIFLRSRYYVASGKGLTIRTVSKNSRNAARGACGYPRAEIFKRSLAWVFHFHPQLL